MKKKLLLSTVLSICTVIVLSSCGSKKNGQANEENICQICHKTIPADDIHHATTYYGQRFTCCSKCYYFGKQRGECR